MKSDMQQINVKKMHVSDELSLMKCLLTGECVHLTLPEYEEAWWKGVY